MVRGKSEGGSPNVATRGLLPMRTGASAVAPTGFGGKKELDCKVDLQGGRRQGSSLSPQSRV